MIYIQTYKKTLTFLLFIRKKTYMLQNQKLTQLSLKQNAR